MNVEKHITVTLTQEDLRQIIVDYLKTKGFNANCEDVNFHVSSHVEGYGFDEYEIKTFDGCSIRCQMD